MTDITATVRVNRPLIGEPNWNVETGTIQKDDEGNEWFHPYTGKAPIKLGDPNTTNEIARSHPSGRF